MWHEIPGPVWHHHSITSRCFCIGFLQSLFQTLLCCLRTHLHIAVVHDTAYNICIICCRVLETTQNPGIVFYSSSMILFTLSYPLFIFCYCFSSISYVKRIIHRGFYIIGAWGPSILLTLSQWLFKLKKYESMPCAWYISKDRRFLSLCANINPFQLVA